MTITIVLLKKYNGIKGRPYLARLFSLSKSSDLSAKIILPTSSRIPSTLKKALSILEFLMNFSINTPLPTHGRQEYVFESIN